VRVEVYGRDHLAALNASRSLGSGYLVASRLQEGMQLLEATHQRYRELFGDAIRDRKTARRKIYSRQKRNSIYGSDHETNCPTNVYSLIHTLLVHVKKPWKLLGQPFGYNQSRLLVVLPTTLLLGPMESQGANVTGTDFLVFYGQSNKGRISFLQSNSKEIADMGSTNIVPIYDGLIDVLAGNVDRDAILHFRIPQSSQERLDELLEKNREGLLSTTETAELETFEQFEHVIRLLKARLLKNERS
jgi:hypothetical protein